MGELAKAKQATESRPKTISETVPIVNLTLDKDEAEALLRILLNVGGPHSGRRGKLANVLDALFSAGVKASRSEGVRGSIYLDEKPDYLSTFGPAYVSSIR